MVLNGKNYDIVSISLFFAIFFYFLAFEKRTDFFLIFGIVSSKFCKIGKKDC